MDEAALSGRMLPHRALAASLAAALAEAAVAFGRLDEALAGHPLRTAFLHRARLDAVRRQADADGQRIDPWHLAAVLEGLRLRMDGALHLVDRGAILDAARHAFALHQWLTAPDFDEEGAVQRAERHLARFDETAGTPLLAAALGAQAWLGGDGLHGMTGGARPPLRAALVRHWMRHRLVRLPVPLTGAAALRTDAPWREPAWLPTFLRALADEAEDFRQLLRQLERAWFAARAAVADRRHDSHAAAAIDLLAAVPLASATSLAGALGVAVKTAIRLLDELSAAGITVEVTHRAKRRLFGLAGLGPLRDAVRPPYRPEPGRGRGRPSVRVVEEEAPEPPPLPALSPLERRVFDYSELDTGLAQLDQVVRRTRRALDVLAGQPGSKPVPVDSEPSANARATPQ